MRFLLVLISAMLLSSQPVMADKLLESGYFNIETHTDHFTVKVLVADLVGRDSWMKDGYIRAYVKEPEVHYNYVEPSHAQNQGPITHGRCHGDPGQF